MEYVSGEVEEEGCLFCNRLAEEDGPGNLILHRGERAFLILNRYPYTNGHLMVVPFVHKDSIEELEDDVLLELIQLTNRAIGLLRHVYGAEAFNVGLNLGEAAGAGVREHVHLHVLPRWSGDTNFMSTTAETRVLPESLQETYARLVEGWKELNPET